MKELLKKLGAKPVKEADIKDKKAVLHVALGKKPDEKETEQVQSQSSSSGNRRLVIVDGVLMEMFESTIIGLVKAGVFTVVWPGTSTPVGRGESRGGYPPDWISPYIP